MEKAKGNRDVIRLLAAGSPSPEKDAQAERSRKYGISIRDDGNVTKPTDYASVPDDEWLDPVNYAYPCHDADHTRSAASYWGRPDNKAKYSEADQKVIDERLAEMGKRLKIGEEGRTAAAMSFNQIRNALCDAFSAAFPNSRGDIIDVYADRCIISDGAGSLFEVPYSVDENGKVTTGDMTKVRRQVDYIAIQAASHILAAADNKDSPDYGYKWYVRVIEPGPDKQKGLNYLPAALKAAAPLYENAKVFALSQGQHADPKNPYGKSVRDLVGWISNITASDNGLDGVLTIMRTAQWLRDELVELEANNKLDILGLSHDAQGQVARTAGAGPRSVERIIRVDSVDVVYNPIGGGRFLRMAAAAQAGQKEAEMLEKLLAALKAQRPDLYATIEAKVKDGTVTEDEVTTLLASAITPAAAGPEAITQVTAAMKEIVAGLKDGTTEKMLEEARIVASGILLKDELRDSGLPDPSQERIKKQFDGKAVTVEQIRAAVKEEKEYVDSLTGSGQVSGSGQVRIGPEEPERIQAAFDKMLGVNVDDRFKDIKPFKGLRAAYAQFTGDEEVTGRPERMSPAGHRIAAAFCDMMRLPAAYSVASFTYLLGTSMYRRLIQDYNAVNYNEDILISYYRNAQDFKTMESIRVGYYGDLPDVTPESIDYTELANVTDEEVSYALNQKGGIVTISRATILNDDLRALQKIPQRLGRAAKRTYAQRVWDKIIDNDTYKGDSKKIFHVDHANLGAVTLTNDATGITTLSNRLIAMYAQTEQDSGKTLALEPMYEWVPRALYEIACGLNSPWPGVAGGNPHAGRFGQNHERIIKLPLTTDVNDWGLVADKNDIELLEVAFMNGQREPEFFVADNPLAGLMFTSDKLQYKIRHEYEVEIDDYRGLDKSVV